MDEFYYKKYLNDNNNTNNQNITRTSKYVIIDESSNAIINFLQSQFKLRKSRLEHKSEYGDESFHQEMSTIYCCGIRQSGTTTAIAHLFDPNKDIYVGFRYAMCNEFYNILKNMGKVDKPKSSIRGSINFLSFETFKFKEGNEDLINELKRKLPEFMKDKMLVEYKDGQVRMDNRLNLDELIVKDQIDNPGIRGKSLKTDECVVYIDLGGGLHTRYSKKIKRIIELFQLTFGRQTDITFVVV